MDKAEQSPSLLVPDTYYQLAYQLPEAAEGNVPFGIPYMQVVPCDSLASLRPTMCDYGGTHKVDDTL